MAEQTAILSDYENYGFKAPPVGLVSTSLNCSPKKKILSFGDGAWIEVQEADLVYIEISQQDIKKVFPYHEG